MQFDELHICSPAGMREKLHVLIAGGGLGGLCLAQGLRGAGHSVTVFERDTDLERKVGYRLHMNADGGEALRNCLPAGLFELYLETSRQTPPRQLAVVVTDQLEELSSMPHIGPPNEGPRPHTAVNRRTLRQILLARLGDSIRLGAPVVSYEETADGVRVRLADGSSEEGDVLVGADGIRSAVRAQRLPEAVSVDTGIEGLGLYARSALPPELQAEIPSVLMDGFVIATDKRGGLLALGAFNPRRPLAEAAADLAPDVRLDPVDDYMMVSGNVAEGTVVPPFAEWTESTATELRDSMLAAHADWHPALRGVVERIDPATMFAIYFGRLEPTPAWEPSRVTLLGDAIHAMLPTLGQGANLALRDAATLAAALADGDDPVAAIGGYETAMRGYAYPIMEAAADHSNFGGGGLGQRDE
jgi:2-polyprenyl-6-methoxyphenol hydroxylase-like FAD-dependent oxidoreductase